MLPDPKKVARILRRTFFQSKEERQQEAELERDVSVRLGKTRLRRHLNRQAEMEKRLLSLAKRALSLNDQTRFRQVGQQLLWTRQDIQRWQQYLLTLEVLEARRDQMKASVELIQAVKGMSTSLSTMAEPGQIGELQRELEQGLARAASLEERMAVMMEVMDAALAEDLRVDEGALENLEAGLLDEIAAQEAAQFDPQIEAGLQKIRDELKQGDR